MEVGVSRSKMDLNSYIVIQFNRSSREIRVQSTFRIGELTLTSTPTLMRFWMISMRYPHHDDRLDARKRKACNDMPIKMKEGHKSWRKRKKFQPTQLNNKRKSRSTALTLGISSSSSRGISNEEGFDNSSH